MRRSAVLAIVIGCAAVVAASGAAKPHYIVRGAVGPHATIALRDGLGNPYTRGGAGMYIITVTDKSSLDGFHLIGPGVDKVITGVSFMGVRTIGVTLGRGVYRYVSDAHPRTLRGTFVLSG